MGVAVGGKVGFAVGVRVAAASAIGVRVAAAGAVGVKVAVAVNVGVRVSVGVGGIVGVSLCGTGDASSAARGPRTQPPAGRWYCRRLRRVGVESDAIEKNEIIPGRVVVIYIYEDRHRGGLSHSTDVDVEVAGITRDVVQYTPPASGPWAPHYVWRGRVCSACRINSYAAAKRIRGAQGVR